jgi:hypothetical protein
MREIEEKRETLIATDQLSHYPDLHAIVQVWSSLSNQIHVLFDPPCQVLHFILRYIQYSVFNL